MSGFEFRLENLLELRVEAESLAAGQLAEARREAEDAMRAHETLETARSSTRSELARLQRQGSDVGRLQSLRLMIDRLEQSVTSAVDALTVARRTLVAARDEYQRANRERRALEELRVKRQRDWSRDTERKDQRVMDEVAAIRHVRGSRSLSRRGEA